MKSGKYQPSHSEKWYDYKARKRAGQGWVDSGEGVMYTNPTVYSKLIIISDGAMTKKCHAFL